MKNIKHRRKQYDHVSLSDSCKAIILGSILGDGSLKKYKGYKNARISIRHSEVQKEYFQWKVNQLNEISNPKSIQTKLVHLGTGYSPKKKLLYQSKSHPELTKLYEFTYKKNKLRIKRKWLNRMTTLSLAIWWLDHGSLIGNKKKGVICTDGFETKQVELLGRYLKIVWGIENRVREIKRTRNGIEYKYPRIWISTKAMRKFIELIKEHVPESMKYKIEMAD